MKNLKFLIFMGLSLFFTLILPFYHNLITIFFTVYLYYKVLYYFFDLYKVF